MPEYGYGIISSASDATAQQFMETESLYRFMPHVLRKERFDPIPEELAAKMHKMIAIIQFKVEGQTCDHSG